MLPAGFEPAIPASDRLQTLALDRSATWMGSIRSPVRPVGSELLYRLSYPGPQTSHRAGAFAPTVRRNVLPPCSG